MLSQVYCESFSFSRVGVTCEQKSLMHRHGGNRRVLFWKTSNVKEFSTQPWQRPVTTWVYKPEAASTVYSSWWWAVCCSKHVENSIKFGIINSITKVHLVGISTESKTPLTFESLLVTWCMFNNHQLYALPTLYLYVVYLPESKQRLVPLTA